MGSHGTASGFRSGCRCEHCQRWFRWYVAWQLSQPMEVNVILCGRQSVRGWGPVR